MKHTTVLALIGIGITWVGAVGVVVENHALQGEVADMQSTLECGLPEKGQILYVAPSVTGKGYDCSISQWKRGQSTLRRSFNGRRDVLL
jgi:hypothetical protein